MKQSPAATERKTPDTKAELAASVARARLRVDVAKQSVRLAKEELKRARKRIKDAKREVRRARKRAGAARKAWKQARKTTPTNARVAKASAAPKPKKTAKPKAGKAKRALKPAKPTAKVAARKVSRRSVKKSAKRIVKPAAKKAVAKPAAVTRTPAAKARPRRRPPPVAVLPGAEYEIRKIHPEGVASAPTSGFVPTVTTFKPAFDTENTSNGPAKSSTSTSSKTRMAIMMFPRIWRAAP